MKSATHGVLITSLDVNQAYRLCLMSHWQVLISMLCVYGRQSLPLIALRIDAVMTE